MTGVLLVGIHIVLAFLSPSFADGRGLIDKPVLLLVGIEIFAGILYLAAVWGIRNTPRSNGLLVWIIAVGTACRVGMLFSTPMLENDYYRYLWDGAVVAEGMNPYAFAPAEVIEGDEGSGTVPAALHGLAERSGTVLPRINHPGLRTIYPPVAQASFALANRFHPWSVFAWRMVLLMFDVTVLGLLALILRASKLPSLSLAIYWWNPLVVREIFNSGHMDVIVLPFVLGAVLLAIRRKHLQAVSALALAVGAKVWPVVLLPVILRRMWAHPRRLIVAVCIFALLGVVMFYPIYASGLEADSGFTAYGNRWEMNDALFMLFLWGTGFSLKIIGSGANAQLVTRAVVLLILALWTARLVREEAVEPADFCERCLLIVAAVFLLSPTQFPWYYVWVAPFLAIRPRWSLLLLTALLPLYYLRFYFSARDNVGIFDYGIVWVEYVPVWLLLIREWYVGRRRGVSLPQEAAA